MSWPIGMASSRGGARAGHWSMSRVRTGTFVLLTAIVVVALIADPKSRAPGGNPGPDLAPSAGEEADWPLHGRTPGEQRHSPLAQVHRANVGDLGLAWSYLTGTKRGIEETPIVVDGVLYATATWSVVFALDAATGRELWSYDPHVPRAKGRDACCDVVNRGVAVAKGRVFVGTIDGRLIALDAATGDLDWETQTADPTEPYTITGAPRVVKNLVVIGNGGAEYGVRGYVSAYQQSSGRLVWRFYTVPASKDGPHEHPELETAARTWPADAFWDSGLGGTVWDSMAFDPELDLLFVGTGNGSVYDTSIRSPGGGDNLYLASILALRPDTGRLVWHYQTTPGERWDYTATQHMILADLEISGQRRKVLLQAPKNGFFYVLDRETGELLSAEKYVHVSWAERVDIETGRPIVRAAALWEKGGATIAPAMVGGHSWHPMSFHPGTGLLYIPTIHSAEWFVPDPSFRMRPHTFNTGVDVAGVLASIEGFEDLRFAPCGQTRLLAWDPVAQERAWEVSHDTGVPGGVLSTAGGLVFQGTGTGEFVAYDADTGDRLWHSDVGIGMMAAPVTYAIDGEQYVVVMAGVGGGAGLAFAEIEYENDGRVLAFKLGGTAPMPAVHPKANEATAIPRLDASPAEIDEGRALYARHCMICHGVAAKSSGLLPDLRRSAAWVHERWNEIIRGGILSANGMASFADVLDERQAEAIHAYVVERARHEPTLVERAVSWGARRGCIPVSWMTD